MQKHTDPLTQEQVTPIEEMENSEDSRKRPASPPSGDGDSKRLKIDSTDDENLSRDTPAEGESGDKMYLSLIGDEVGSMRINQKEC